MKELKYYKSKNHKKRDRVASLFAIFFSGFFVLILFNSDAILTLAFFVLFFIIGIFLFFNSFRNKVTVILNNTGIYSKNNGSGLIEWKFVNSFKINDTDELEFLVVELIDIDGALKNKNPLTKFLMKTNIKRLGSPVVFPSMQFHKPLEDVLVELNEFRNTLQFEFGVF